VLAALLTVAIGASNSFAQEVKPPAGAASGKLDRERDKKKSGDDERDREREDLAGRLMRKSVAESDEALMESVLRLMDESSHRMEIDFDSGAKTQDLQKQISDKLDEAIKIAASQRRKIRQNNSSSSSDRRRAPKQIKPSEKQGATSAAGKAKESSPDERKAPGGVEGPKESARGEIRDVRRGWGQLPDRQRDEVIQGSGEDYLERYRQWIEKYYRALQESGQ